MVQKILFVLTSHSKLGNTNKKTGWYLPEVAHPYNYLSQYYEIVIASPNGGHSPMDPSSLEAFKNDAECQKFLNNSIAKTAIKNTISLKDVESSILSFVAVIYPGGHGPMFDLATDIINQRICAKIYENNGIVGAVCHGPAAVVNVKLSNGTFLVKGKKITAFSNHEEDAVALSNIIPFMLQDELIKNGGIYECAENLWQCHVVTDGQLISGQNPASSWKFAEKVHDVISSIKNK